MGSFGIGFPLLSGTSPVMRVFYNAADRFSQDVCKHPYENWAKVPCGPVPCCCPNPPTAATCWPLSSAPTHNCVRSVARASSSACNSSRPLTAPFRSAWIAHDLPWPESVGTPALPSRQGTLYVCSRPISCRRDTHGFGKSPVAIAIVPPSGPVLPITATPRQHRQTSQTNHGTPNHNPRDRTKPDRKSTRLN